MRRLPCLMMRDWASPVYCLSPDTSRFQVSRRFKSRRLHQDRRSRRGPAISFLCRGI